VASVNVLCEREGGGCKQQHQSDCLVVKLVINAAAQDEIQGRGGRVEWQVQATGHKQQYLHSVEG
jgi:hypothetical protein